MESPDILQRFITANDIGAATTSIASIKLSADSINTKSQQVRPFSNSYNSSNTNNNTTTTSFIQNLQQTNHHEKIQTTSSTNATATSSERISGLSDISCGSGSSDYRSVGCLSTAGKTKILNTIFESTSPSSINHAQPTPMLPSRNPNNIRTKENRSSLLEFSLSSFSVSSVGRSFFDGSEANAQSTLLPSDSLTTPDTPTPNISPSSSSIVSNRCFSETFSNDFIKPSTPSVIVSPLDENAPKRAYSTAATVSSTTTNNGGSWDLLELDLDFHHVNCDPSFGRDVEERVFFGDDPLGILPQKATDPDSHDL